MDAHRDRVDPQTGGGPRGLSDKARAALAALVEAARRLGPAGRRRLANHLLETDRGNAQEDAEGDRRNAP